MMYNLRIMLHARLVSQQITSSRVHQKPLWKLKRKSDFMLSPIVNDGHTNEAWKLEAKIGRKYLFFGSFTLFKDAFLF